MSTEFKGLLQSPAKPSTALRVTIALSAEEVEMFSEIGFIGRWPTQDMSVERAGDSWFKVRLDENEWDFEADDPTGFFLAAPLNEPRAARDAEPAQNRRSVRISVFSRLAIGAVLAVFLLSLGIVIGRYQLDGTELALANILVFAAVLGAGWAGIRTSGQMSPEGRKRPGPSLKVNGPRAALRVADVIREERQHATGPGSPLDRQSAHETPPSGDDANRVSDVTGEEDPNDSPHHSATENGQYEAANAATRPTGPQDGVTDIERSEGGEEPLAETGDVDGLLDVSARDAEEAPDLRIEQRIIPSAAGSQPAWIHIAYEADPPTSATNSDADRSSATPSEQSEPTDESLLPTEAIKRYLASLSRLEEEARSRGESTKEAAVEDVAGTDGSDGGTIALTEIRGIGPALSTALGQLGVNTVHDLAELDSTDLDYLQEQLGRFGPRMKSERWVEQARHMIRSE